MTEYVTRAGLQVAEELARFVETRALPETGVGTDHLWQGLADILARFVPLNRALLAKRDEIQAKLDAWHAANPGPINDMPAYQAYLREIGYLVPEPAPFAIGTQNVDAEIATMAGPQLVVPSLNDRFVLNAANARWGSLYDALYGTDVLDAAPAKPGGYDAARGAAVVAYARHFLNETIPRWEAALDGQHAPHFVAKTSDGTKQRYLFKQNGLHIEIVVDPAHPIGATDDLGIADVILESALTTIVDLEDSVAAVDAEDKVAAYTNWLGLMRGDLVASFDKGGRTMTRALDADREYDGLTLPGRSLMFVRNVGHLMTNPAITAARWQRSARRHPRRAVHLALRAARPDGPRHRTATAARGRSTSSSPRCTVPKRPRSPTPCSMRWRMCSALRATPSRSASWTRNAAPAPISPRASMR